MSSLNREKNINNEYKLRHDSVDDKVAAVYKSLKRKRNQQRKKGRRRQREDGAHKERYGASSEGTSGENDFQNGAQLRQETANGNEANASTVPKRRHNFETHALDHCETPLVAYQHLRPVLEAIAVYLKIHPPQNLRIWDPYFCDGTVQRHLAECGFPNVINENVDFYTLNESPPHDVLVTNPPYSGDHIELLLRFCLEKNKSKPLCLLMPNWVARKPDYKDMVGKDTPLFYLTPLQPYTYTMPAWVAEKPTHVSPKTGHTTPYLSSWYISSNNHTSTIEDRMNSLAKRQTPPPEWVVAKTIKGLKWKIQKYSNSEGKKKNG